MTALDVFQSRTGIDLPNLMAARRLTASRKEKRSKLLGALRTDFDASVVLMGSWGRAEVTLRSDDDYMVVILGEERDNLCPTVTDVADALRGTEEEIKSPGPEELFGVVVFSERLKQNIGLDRDDNTNLTRRMLLLLESVAVVHPDIHDQARADILSGYLDDSLKDHHPPRFLLNDIVRYWRTMCVDFAGKERTRKGQGWGLRNAKLRTSRKVLFAGGLLPVLRCRDLLKRDMERFLVEQLRQPPTDRLADAFLTYDELDAGQETFQAYDRFIGHLADDEFRLVLQGLGNRQAAAQSPYFREAVQLGEQVEAGLLTLLFGPLAEQTRQFGIF